MTENARAQSVKAHLDLNGDWLKITGKSPRKKLNDVADAVVFAMDGKHF